MLAGDAVLLWVVVLCSTDAAAVKFLALAAPYRRLATRYDVARSAVVFALSASCESEALALDFCPATRTRTTALDAS